MTKNHLKYRQCLRQCKYIFYLELLNKDDLYYHRKKFWYLIHEMTTGAMQKHELYIMARYGTHSR